MAALRNYPVLLAAGMIALVGVGAESSQEAPMSMDLRAARGDLQACAKGRNYQNPPLIAPTDASVADFARLLNGAWLRRLTIGGEPVETNSFLYFDISSSEAGRGQALMIDRIDQGWDSLATAPGSADTIPARKAEPLAPATTGAYWSVSIKPAPADAASQGHSGVTLALAGDYRGTGDDYPPNGFQFTETGTFYRDRTAYATLHPWKAPPQATASAEAPATNTAEPSSSVDAVIVEVGDADSAHATARPTLTFIICQDKIVDRYYKISNATPTVQGVPLRAAWDAAIASGIFRTLPAR